MEIFDLYDKEGQLLHKTMERGNRNQKGEYHLVVHIWIRSHNGKYLIQQRNKTTDIIPNQWGTTAGAVLKGETSLEGAIRETKEEIGISLRQKDFKKIKRFFVDDDYSNYITDIYLVEKNIDLATCKLDKREVLQVAYKSMKEIKEMIGHNQFWDYEHIIERKGYFSLLEKS